MTEIFVLVWTGGYDNPEITVARTRVEAVTAAAAAMDEAEGNDELAMLQVAIYSVDLATLTIEELT